MAICLFISAFIAIFPRKGRSDSSMEIARDKKPSDSVESLKFTKQITLTLVTDSKCIALFVHSSLNFI